MKKIFKIVFLFLLIFLTSCEMKLDKYAFYENEKEYYILNETGNEITSDVLNINLDWIKGSIKIDVSNTINGVFISENIKGNYEDEHLTRYCLKDGTLNIKYCKSNTSMPSNVRKSIIIQIGSNVNLSNLSINNVAATLDIGLVNVKKIKVNNVSGAVKISKTISEEIEYNGVSGALTCILTQKTFKVEVNQVSASTIVALPSTTAGFLLDFESISGSISYDDFSDAIIYDGDIIYLDRTYLDIKVNTTSGSLTISKYLSEEPKIDRVEKKE